VFTLHETVRRCHPRRLCGGAPGVAHSFANDGDEDAAWLDVHTPDAGFAAYLRGARDGRAVPFDSFDVPAETGGDRGRPAAEAVLVAPGADPGLAYDGPDPRVVADRFRVDVVAPGGAARVSYCRIQHACIQDLPTRLGLLGNRATRTRNLHTAIDMT
jgi:hypothetical protein